MTADEVPLFLPVSFQSTCHIRGMTTGTDVKPDVKPDFNPHATYVA